MLSDLLMTAIATVLSQKVALICIALMAETLNVFKNSYWPFVLSSPLENIYSVHLPILPQHLISTFF